MFNNPNMTPEAFLAIGSALAGGQNMQQQLGNIAPALSPILAQQKQTQQLAQETNATRAFLQSTYPGQDFSNYTNDMLKSAATEALKAKMEAQKPKTPAKSAMHDYAEAILADCQIKSSEVSTANDCITHLDGYNNGHEGPDHCGGVCGDGTVDVGEACDDGVNSGDPGFCDTDCSGIVPIEIGRAHV